MLEFKYAQKSDVPAEYLSLYTEVGGEWVLTGVVGLKTQEDIDRITESLRKERNDHSITKAKLKPFDGMNAEEVLAKLDRIEELEVANGKNLNEEEINKMVETRLRSRTAPLDRKISELEGTVTARTEELGVLQGNARRQTIHNEIRRAGGVALCRDSAIEDALELSNRVFEVNDVGHVVTRDNVGVTPGLSPDVWFTEMKSTRSHWWPESKGAGLKGGRGGEGGSNPFTMEGWNLTEQSKITTSDRASAEQLAKSAGTTIGGPKPAK